MTTPATQPATTIKDAMRLVLVLILLGLGSQGCYRESSVEKEEAPTTVATTTQRPPIVMISIDTLRSDRLPAYGYDGGDTPAIDALRADSILFRHAYCHIPITLPSHASLLTGLLPQGHGVRDNVGYRLDSDGMLYLPTELKRLGYATGGAVSVFLMHRRSGLANGFDFYEDHFTTRVGTGSAGVQRPGLDTLRPTLDWLRTVKDQSFFLFLHLYEPHAPYTPPEPFASRFASPYDGEIAAADQVVGELITELRRLGRYDEAMILLLSDHGEGLGDHGEREHGVLLYRESLQVPLLLKLPTGERGGDTVERPVQLIDVVPTVLGLLGEAVPSSLPGVSLLASGDELAARHAYAETFYPRLHFGWNDLASLIAFPWHFIDGPDPELYDLVADPGEKRNLLQEERQVSRQLRQAILAYDRSLEPPEATVAESAETREALGALGYLGGVSQALSGELPDPKSKIHTLETFDRGIEHVARGELDAAIEAFRETVAANPLMTDAWEYLADTLARAGRLQEAFTTYERALEVSGNAPHLAVKASALLIPSGDWQQVLSFVRQQLVHSPQEIRLRLLESRSLMFLGRADEALSAAEEALALNAENADAVYQRGAVEMALRRLDAAEKDLRRAIALAPDHLAAMSDLAVLLKARGNTTEARQLAERVLELSPNDRLARQLLEQLASR